MNGKSGSIAEIKDGVEKAINELVEAKNSLEIYADDWQMSASVNESPSETLERVLPLIKKAAAMGRSCVTFFQHQAHAGRYGYALGDEKPAGPITYTLVVKCDPEELAKALEEECKGE